MIVNPRTDRIRKIVVESGAGNLNQWLDYERTAWYGPLRLAGQ